MALQKTGATDTGTLLISGYGQVILIFFCSRHQYVYTNVHCSAFKMGKGNQPLAQVQQSSGWHSQKTHSVSSDTWRRWCLNVPGPRPLSEWQRSSQVIIELQANRIQANRWCLPVPLDETHMCWRMNMKNRKKIEKEQDYVKIPNHKASCPPSRIFIAAY